MAKELKRGRPGRFLMVERTDANGNVLQQEVHESKWNNRHQPWQKKGWTIAKVSSEPLEAKKTGKSKKAEVEQEETMPEV